MSVRGEPLLTKMTTFDYDEIAQHATVDFNTAYDQALLKIKRMLALTDLLDTCPKKDAIGLRPVNVLINDLRTVSRRIKEW